MEKKKEGKKVKGKWMLWEASIFKRFFTRLGSVRNRRSWTAWSRRNIWKQYSHLRGARKIATYRECIENVQGSHGRIVWQKEMCLIPFASVVPYPAVSSVCLLWSFRGDAGSTPYCGWHIWQLWPTQQPVLQHPDLAGVLLSFLLRNCRNACRQKCQGTSCVGQVNRSPEDRKGALPHG